MRTTINLHPTRFSAEDFTSAQNQFATVEVFVGEDSRTSIFLDTPAECDALIAATERAKSFLQRAGGQS